MNSAESPVQNRHFQIAATPLGSLSTSLLLHVALLSLLFLIKAPLSVAPRGQTIKGEAVFLTLSSRVYPHTSKPHVSRTPIQGDIAVAQPTPKPRPQREVQTSEIHSNATAAQTQKNTTVRLGQSDGREASERERYIYELRRFIESRKQYPALSQRLRETGRVLVRFAIERDGDVLDAKLVAESRFTRLNEAALELVKSLGRVRPLPSEVQSERLEVEVPIEYVLR